MDIVLTVIIRWKSIMTTKNQNIKGSSEDIKQFFIMMKKKKELSYLTLSIIALCSFILGAWMF
jgi:hypothetical protein